MNQIKNYVTGLSAQMAALFNAGFAVVFLIFFLVLPQVTAGAGFFSVSMSGAKLISGANFFSVLVWLVVLLAPVCATAWPAFKKTLNPCAVPTLALVYVVYTFTASSAMGLGIGAILNIILVLAPWVTFTHFRKGMPATYEGINNMTNNGGPKLPGQK